MCCSKNQYRQVKKECRDILALAKKNDHIVIRMPRAPVRTMSQNFVNSFKTKQSVKWLASSTWAHWTLPHEPFVRCAASWHNSKQTTPINFSKVLPRSWHSSLDDWQNQAKSIHAFGTCRGFKNAPAGNADAAPMAARWGYVSIFSARVGYRRRGIDFDLPEDKEDKLKAHTRAGQLRTTNTGVAFTGWIMINPIITLPTFYLTITLPASFNILFIVQAGRTRVMGSHGDIVGDMIFVSRLLTSEVARRKVERKQPMGMAVATGGWHENWVQGRGNANPALLTSAIDQSIESHVMGKRLWRRSRKNKKVMDIRM